MKKMKPEQAVLSNPFLEEEEEEEEEDISPIFSTFVKPVTRTRVEQVTS
jgi:hypothetical protein